MNCNLTLWKIISSLILMIGLLAPVKPIQSASTDASTNEASKRHQALTDEKATEEHHQTVAIPKFLLSKKAQEIEFFSFLGIIGLSIFVPEIFYKPKQNSQTINYSEHHENQQKNSKKTKQLVTSLEVISKNTKSFSVAADNSDNSQKINNQEKIELENQSESEQEAA